MLPLLAVGCSTSTSPVIESCVCPKHVVFTKQVDAALEACPKNEALDLWQINIAVQQEKLKALEGK